jgi:hypothetical protein
MQGKLAAGIAALALCVACGEDSDADGGHGGHHHNPEQCKAPDTFERGITRAGKDGLVNVTISEAAPATPIVADNTWTVTVTDASGQPLEDAELSMNQTMPEHEGHGTPRTAIATKVGPGKYELSPVAFTMAGLWKIPIKIVKGELEDTVEFQFCV